MNDDSLLFLGETEFYRA